MKPRDLECLVEDLKVLASGTLLCLGLLLGGCASQGEHVILPGAAHQGRPEAILPPSPHYELLSLQLPGGSKVAAEFGPALDPQGRPMATARFLPTILFFYGNGAYLAGCQAWFEGLRRLGVNVLMPEYPGYGMSEGRPSENGCYATADAAYACLMSRADIDPARVVVAGHSLGGAVAIDLASRRQVAGLVTLSTFTSIRDVLHADLPWPARYLAPWLSARCKFESLAKIPGVSCPILLIHGTADSLIPPRMSERLANAASSKVTRVSVDGADHLGILDMNAGEPWRSLARWLQELSPTHPDSQEPRLGAQTIPRNEPSGVIRGATWR